MPHFCTCPHTWQRCQACALKTESMFVVCRRGIKTVRESFWRLAWISPHLYLPWATCHIPSLANNNFATALTCLLLPDQYLEWGPNRPDDPKSTDHINPCMSTGFWFIQPTQPAREFLEAFIDLELYWRNWQTDQRLWNEVRAQNLLSAAGWEPTHIFSDQSPSCVHWQVIMAFLIGQGKRRPLIFSLLDTDRFSNFGELIGFIDGLQKHTLQAGVKSMPCLEHTVQSSIGSDAVLLQRCTTGGRKRACQPIL